MKNPPLTDLARSALEDLKAIDLKILDVRGLTTITDVMMICTGTSNRHVVSLARHVYDTVREAGHPVLGIEGLDEGEWALVDLGDVVVPARGVVEAAPKVQRDARSEQWRGISELRVLDPAGHAQLCGQCQEMFLSFQLHGSGESDTACQLLSSLARQ